MGKYDPGTRSSGNGNDAGPEEFLTPINLIPYANRLLASVQITPTFLGSPWVTTNVSVGSVGVTTSPIGNPYAYQVTDTSGAGTGVLKQTILNGVFGATDTTVASVYVLLGSGTGIAKLRHTRTGGAPTLDASVTFRVDNGDVVSATATSYTAELFALPGGTWLRISIVLVDTGGNLGGTWEFFPDTTNTGNHRATIQGVQVAAPYATGLPPSTAQFTKPAYIPSSQVQGQIELEQGAIPRYNTDTRWVTVNGYGGGDTWKVRFPEMHGWVLTFTTDGNIALPAPGDLASTFPLQAGFYFFIDCAQTLHNANPFINISGGTVTIVGLGVTSPNVQFNLLGDNTPGGAGFYSYGTRAASSLWLMLYRGAGDWLAVPMGNAHGSITYTANDVFKWPEGVQTVYITGSAGGGGGANGGAAGGGGGGAGEAKQKFVLQTGIPNTSYTITVGAGGAAGAAGANSSFGALLTLLGGAAGAAAVGGAAGAAGGQAGSSGAVAVGGKGGDNIAGGVGGVCQNVAAASTAGQLGGGGGGGAAGQNAGAGGNGYLTVEW